LLIFFTFITFVIFNPLLASILHLPILKFVDDGFLVVLTISLIFQLRFLYKFKEFKSTINIFLSLFLIGSISLFLNHGVFSFPRLILGSLFFLKPFILFFSGLVLGIRVFKSNFLIYLKLYIYIVFGIVLIGGIIDFLAPTLWRHFLNLPLEFHGQYVRVLSFFMNAGRSAWMFSLIIIYFISYLIIFRKNIKNKVIIYFLTVVTFILEYATYVKKSMLGIMFIVGYLNLTQFTIKRFLYFILFSTIFIFIFQDHFLRFAKEYSAETLTIYNSRFMLFLGAFLAIKETIFKTLFGIGFGTWGGFASSILYSPYYYKFHFDKLWGFMPGASSYTGDNYFAHVIAEVGIIGFIVTFLLYKKIFNIYKLGYQRTENHNKTFKLFALFFMLGYLELMVELLGICASEISTVSFFIIFIPAIYIGTLFKSIQ